MNKDYWDFMGGFWRCSKFPGVTLILSSSEKICFLFVFLGLETKLRLSFSSRNEAWNLVYSTRFEKTLKNAIALDKEFEDLRGTYDHKSSRIYKESP